MRKKNRFEQLVVVLVSLLFLSTAVYAAAHHVRQALKPTLSVPTEVVLPEKGEDAALIVNGRERKPNCYNILISGLDNGNGGSDTNILMQFDAGGKSIDLVSLPRDTLLHHEWISNKLNYSYAKGGTELLCSEIENLLGVPVDFTVTVDLEGFVALVDQIGGVDFDIPVDMNYDDPAQNLSIHFSKGPRHLTGAEAIKVVRWRKNNDGTGYAAADIGRIGTQQAFLKAVAKQLLQVSNVRNVSALADIFSTYVKTDLTLGNLVWLGSEALKIVGSKDESAPADSGGLNNVNFYTLPGDGSGYYRKESVYVLNREETLLLINHALNPYVDPITVEQTDILVP